VTGSGPSGMLVCEPDCSSMSSCCWLFELFMHSSSSILVRLECVKKKKIIRIVFILVSSKSFFLLT
jgi:hypothetical protein